MLCSRWIEFLVAFLLLYLSIYIFNHVFIFLQSKDSVFNQSQYQSSPVRRALAPTQTTQRRTTATDSRNDASSTMTDATLKSKADSEQSQYNYMTPETAMKQCMHKLTSFEHHEIFSYPTIYFTGATAKKRQGIVGGSNNNGYDDDQCSYIPVTHDHVAYRYEILKVIGKGSFGQVNIHLFYKSFVPW